MCEGCFGGGGGEGKRRGREGEGRGKGGRKGERGRREGMERKGKKEGYYSQRYATRWEPQAWPRGGTRRSRHSGTPSALGWVKEAWWLKFGVSLSLMIPFLRIRQNGHADIVQINGESRGVTLVRYICPFEDLLFWLRWQWLRWPKAPWRGDMRSRSEIWCVWRVWFRRLVGCEKDQGCTLLVVWVGILIQRLSWCKRSKWVSPYLVSRSLQKASDRSQSEYRFSRSPVNSILIHRLGGVCTFLALRWLRLSAVCYPPPRCRLVHGDLACAHWKNWVVSGRKRDFQIYASFWRIPRNFVWHLVSSDEKWS